MENDFVLSNSNSVKKVLIFLTTLLFFVAIFFSTYRLTESPPVWMDEGVIVQTAKNLAEKGVYGLQIAPNKFVSSGFVTTSYPLIYPIALSLKFFGVGILQARIVMVAFILVFFIAAYLLIRKSHGLLPAFFSLALLISFAPVYGHGKNVLGEIPGLFFLLCLLLSIHKIEISDSPKTIFFILAGIFAGLSMSTKPIFLDLLSFSIIVSFLAYRSKKFLIRKIYIFGGVTIVMLLIWIYIHFSGDNFSSIISNYYGNPDHTPLLATIKDNFLKFFKEPQLIYFTLTMSMWVAAICLRRKTRSKIYFVEVIALIFSITNLFAFFATLGFNRYFFPGQALSVIFLPISIFYFYKYISSRMKTAHWIFKLSPYILLSCLILFQFYQTIFHSWVADYYRSRRSAILTEYFSTVSKDKVVMFYDIPEVVLFSSSDNYYQYMRFAENVQVGKESVDAIKNNVVDMIITNERAWKNLNATNSPYKFTRQLDKYQIFEKI